MAHVPPFARGMSAAARTVLKPANRNNRVVLNFWKPGYNIEQIIKTKDNKERQVKVFTARAYPQCRGKKMGEDFGMIFANFDEGIFFIFPRRNTRKTPKRFPRFFPLHCG